MSTFKARGLVIREVTVGESDKILILLLKDIGKLSVSAKGARKAKSKFLAGTQLFSYADFVIYDGGKFYSLCEVNLIESFYELRNDYDRLCYANLFVEIADKTIPIQMPCDDIIYLLLISLSELNRERRLPAIVGAGFELKYLQQNGYGAVTDICSNCGEEITACAKVYFCQNGVLCGDCGEEDRSSLYVARDTLSAVDYILNSEIKDIYKFRADAKIVTELLMVSRFMTDSHFEMRFKSRELLG